MMELIPVDSSNIKAIGYDSGKIRIEFRSGSIWEYGNIPVEVWDAFRSAESKGQYFTRFIRPKFRGERVDLTF